jgi:hypothetical protein
MSSDNQHLENRSDDQRKGGSDVNRREAFGRFAQYTAPVMLALLTSEPAAAVSVSCFVQCNEEEEM